METLKSSDSPRVMAEKINKNLSLSKKGYKYHFDVKPPANPDEKTLWIDLFVKTIIKEINTRTYADEYFKAHPDINRNTFKFIGSDGKPTLEFKKMIYGDDYDPHDKHILQPKNNTIEGFCDPIEKQSGIKQYDLDKIVFNTNNVTTMVKAFDSCKKLKYIYVYDWDTSKVTDMKSMFNECKSLTSLDISKFNTSKVTDMRYMFYYCESLTSLDVSKWDTSRVTDMEAMFYNCSNLTSLDVSKWDTGRVTNMRFMFYECESLTSLDISKFNTSKVTDMRYMFYGCESLTSLDVSKWDTSRVTDMRYMFSYCKSITSLDISKFNTSKVTDMRYMFINSTNLSTINGVLDLKSCSNVDGMFLNTPNLKSIKVKNLKMTLDEFCKNAKIDKSKVIVVS